MGTIYLIHFDSRLHHAGHYLGYVNGKQRALANRIKRHKAGKGARLLQVLLEKGIDFHVVRTWEDKTRLDERSMKNKRNTPRLCPLCKIALQAKRKKF